MEGRPVRLTSREQGGDGAVSAEAGEVPQCQICSARPGAHAKVPKDSGAPRKDFKQGQPEGS